MTAPKVACAEHWKLLPGYLRARIYSLERVSPSADDYLRVAAEVRAWIAKEFAGTADRDDPGRWERLKRYVRARDEARRERRATTKDEDSDEPAPT